MPPNLTTKRKICYAALTVALATLVALGAAEIVLRRLFIRPVRIAAHYPLGLGAACSRIAVRQLEYEVEFRYSKYGFRGPEFRRRKDPDEVRVLFLGDSFVEGLGVHEHERLSEVLADLLKTRNGLNASSLNAGQIASQPVSYCVNLFNFGIALRPDAVVMGLSLCNDFMYAREPSVPDVAFRISGRFPPLCGPVRDEPPWWSSSYLLTALNHALQRTPSPLHRRMVTDQFWEVYYRKPINKDLFLEMTKLSEAEFDAHCRKLDPEFVDASLRGLLNPGGLTRAIKRRTGPPKAADDPDSARYHKQDVAAVVNLLHRAHRTLAERRIPFVVLIIPDVFQVYPEESREFLAKMGFDEPPPRVTQLPEIRDWLVAHLRSYKIPHVDMTDVFRAAGEPTYHIRDQHCNALGHRLMAEELHKVLVPLLPSHARRTASRTE